MMMRYLLLLLHLFVYCQLQGQNNHHYEQNPQARFEEAQKLAKDGQITKAKNICREIIHSNSDYYDVVIYLANLHGRDAEYQSAVELLNPALLIDPPVLDAHRAICNIYYWSNQWNKLYNASQTALQLFPNESEFLYLNALALYHIDKQSEALDVIEDILATDPENARAKNLRKLIYTEGDFIRIFTSYNFDRFQEPYDRRWHQVTSGCILPIKRFKFIPSISAGHAIDQEKPFIANTAAQLNIDTYIKLSESNNLLLGYGFGSGTYLPRHRAIIHYWQSLAAGWALSGGARYFNFNQDFLFYAVGIEKYVGDYWFELMNYLFRKEYGLSATIYFTARRYFENSENYLGLSAGYGTSPDEPIAIVSDFERLNAISFKISYNKQIGIKSMIGIGAGYMHDEYKEQFFRNRFNGFINYSIKIK